jgi:hypothetical protein
MTGEGFPGEALALALMSDVEIQNAMAHGHVSPQAVQDCKFVDAQQAEITNTAYTVPERDQHGERRNDRFSGMSLSIADGAAAKGLQPTCQSHRHLSA